MNCNEGRVHVSPFLRGQLVWVWQERRWEGATFPHTSLTWLKVCSRHPLGSSTQREKTGRRRCLSFPIPPLQIASKPWNCKLWASQSANPMSNLTNKQASCVNDHSIYIFFLKASIISDFCTFYSCFIHALSSFYALHCDRLSRTHQWNGIQGVVYIVVVLVFVWVTMVLMQLVHIVSPPPPTTTPPNPFSILFGCVVIAVTNGWMMWKCEGFLGSYNTFSVWWLSHSCVP